MSDWPAWITAAATVAYVGVSWALWRSNRQQSRHTQESFDLARKAFEAAHQPVIAVGLRLEPALTSRNTLDHFKLTCRVENNGQDAASELELTILSTGNYFGRTLRFGELYPGQSRETTVDFTIDYAGARMWISEKENSGAIKFEITRRYKTSTGELKCVKSLTEEMASDYLVGLWRVLSEEGLRQGR